MSASFSWTSFPDENSVGDLGGHVVLTETGLKRTSWSDSGEGNVRMGKSFSS